LHRAEWRGTAKSMNPRQVLDLPADNNRPYHNGLN
jgi:hypothetical protein